VARALSLCRDAPGPAASALGTIAIIEPLSLAARCLTRLGAMDREAGRAEQALACFQQALDLARSGGDWGAETRARTAIGRIRLEYGDGAAALEQARAALGTSNAVGDRVGQATALRLLAAVSAARGDYASAERDAHHALVISAGARAWKLEAQLWEDMAAMAQAQGNDEDVTAARHEVERLQRLRWDDAAPAEAMIGAA
jgi:tetratricopeptide (TPR) repeat protein